MKKTTSIVLFLVGLLLMIIQVFILEHMLDKGTLILEYSNFYTFIYALITLIASSPIGIVGLIVSIIGAVYMSNLDKKLKTKGEIKMALTIVGMIMICFQLVVSLISYTSGVVTFFTNVTNFSVFIFDLISFLSFNLIGVIGFILLMIGAVLRNRKE